MALTEFYAQNETSFKSEKKNIFSSSNADFNIPSKIHHTQKPSTYYYTKTVGVDTSKENAISKV